MSSVSSAVQSIAAARGAYARRDWNAAIPALAEVTAQTPKNGLYRFMLARARFEAKDYAGALADYQRALDFKGDDPAVIAFQIAKCHALLGLVDRKATSRNAGWRADIRFLTDWVSKKSYHPFKTSTTDRHAPSDGNRR